MSQLVGQAASSGWPIAQSDNRALAIAFAADVEMPVNGDMTTPWWPGSGYFGEQGADVSVKDTSLKWWEYPDTTRGANGRYGIVGITRDVYNSPLGGVTVKCFRAATDELVSTIVSDPLGNYTCTTPYTDAHYCVSFGTGVQGVTAPTIFGA
jgi:hypothetical protein